MEKAKPKTTPIILGWYGQAAQLCVDSKGGIRLILFQAAISDESGSSPAMSMEIYGEFALRAIRDALIAEYPI